MRATPNAVKKRYTWVHKVGERWNCYFIVDSQHFTIVEQTTKKRAEWFSLMLSKAIFRLLEKEKNGIP